MKQRTVFLLMIAALILSAIPTSAQTCPSTPRTLPLVVNATTTVGSVTVVNDLTHIYVTVTAVAGYSIDQVQLQVATSAAGLPKNSHGDPQTANFATQASFPSGVPSQTFTLPRGAVTPGSPVFVAVHALVHQGTTCQSSSDGEDDDHDHEGDHGGDHSSSGGHSSSTNGTNGGSCSGGDHHGDHNSDDDGHCSDVSSDNDSYGSHFSVSGHSSSSGSSHGDDHHGDDHHGDDNHSHDHNCSCSKQSAWAGNLLFPGNTPATYFTFTVNCGVPE